MPVDPGMIADSASKIAGFGEEVDHRNAASRAYYALYHAAHQLMLSEVKAIKRYPGCGMHQWLINHLDEIGQQEESTGKITPELGAEIADALSQIKRLRVNADYKLHLRFRESDALLAIEYARDYLDKIGQLMQREPEPANQTH